jgi:hypothetical protein
MIRHLFVIEQCDRSMIMHTHRITRLTRFGGNLKEEKMLVCSVERYVKIGLISNGG